MEVFHAKIIWVCPNTDCWGSTRQIYTAENQYGKNVFLLILFVIVKPICMQYCKTNTISNLELITKISLWSMAKNDNKTTKYNIDKNSITNENYVCKFSKCWSKNFIHKRAQ